MTGISTDRRSSKEDPLNVSSPVRLERQQDMHGMSDIFDWTLPVR